MINESILWVVFAVGILVMLVIDLGFFQRKAHAAKIKEALIWSAVWISLGLLFGLGIYFTLGHEKALQYLTGYLLEKSLSVDNLFVFLMIFSYFAVARAYQHKVLFWGILGALIMRGIFIGAGLAIVERLHWIIYIFGAFLVYTGIRMFSSKEEEVHPEKNPVLRIFRKLVPMTRKYHGAKFLFKRRRRYLATPLLLVLVVIETTDVVFAVDSIPAVLAVTLDPFIVYTSNVFAILGLRALYFALCGVLERLAYLHYGLAVILVFLGLKMLTSWLYEMPVGISLAVVAGVLATAVIFSLLRPKKIECASGPEEESIQDR